MPKGRRRSGYSRFRSDRARAGQLRATPGRRGVGGRRDHGPLDQVDPLRVEAILPSDWFGRTQPGDRAEIVPEGADAAPQVARVELVDPVIDGASGTFVVHLLLPNPDRALPAGLRCEVRFLGRGGEHAEAGPSIPVAAAEPADQSTRNVVSPTGSPSK